MIFSKDSAARSWVAGSQDSEFCLQNLPYGVFHTPGGPGRIGVAIGESVLNYRVLP